jgi:hypothetical protein
MTLVFLILRVRPMPFLSWLPDSLSLKTLWVLSRTSQLSVKRKLTRSGLKTIFVNQPGVTNMALTINAKTYTADSPSPNSVGYSGPAHTVTVKDYTRLSRVAPKPTTTSSGVGRTSAKLTRTLPLTAALEPVRDAILDVAFTMPVGCAGADVDTMLNDFGAFVASATFKLHVKNQMINA